MAQTFTLQQPSWEFTPLEEFLQHKWILQLKGHWPDLRSRGYHVRWQLKIKLVHDSRRTSGCNRVHVTRRWQLPCPQPLPALPAHRSRRPSLPASGGTQPSSSARGSGRSFGVNK